VDASEACQNRCAPATRFAYRTRIVRQATPVHAADVQPGGRSSLFRGEPCERSRAGLAYDRRRKQVVLFGGVSAPTVTNEPTFLDDTWVFEHESWRRVAAVGLRRRYAHGTAYDERAGVVLLYGGAAAHQNAPLSDMWKWDGSRWTEIRLDGPTPGYRYQPVMVYDRARGVTLLYGGAPDGNTDTCELNGARWTRIAAPSRVAEYPFVLSYRTVAVANGVYAFITPEERTGFQAGNSIVVIGEDAVLVLGGKL
jgi:hypothetical protein